VSYNTPYIHQQPSDQRQPIISTRTIGPLAKVKGVYVNQGGVIKKVEQAYVNDGGTLEKMHQSVPTAQFQH
jgi:hypothetical protein